MRYDATLKQLFERSAHGLVQMLTGASVTAWLNVEMPRVNVPRLDLLGRLSRGPLCNIEFQTTNETHLAKRVGVYYLQAWIKHNEEIEQIVLYLGKEALNMEDSINSASMQFKFRLIDIGELDGEQLAASGDLGDAMLAILAKVKSRPEMIRRALNRIATLREKDRELAVEQLVILTGLRGLEVEIIEEAREYMPFVVDLMENRIVRMRYERGVAAGELKILRTLLQKRFGLLPEWAEKQLEGASPDQMEAWSLRVLDAETLEEVLGKP